NDCPGGSHSSCPACGFLAVAAFFAAPDAVIVPISRYIINTRVFFDYRQPYQQVFYKSCFVRGPPVLFA
ncbi:MAG: hypothetical protein KAX15_04495, partial [Candidatus Omnitrophica bacterium]|nr:hypothetical protein [Candidatus Omnitrophota bacterium]